MSPAPLRLGGAKSHQRWLQTMFHQRRLQTMSHQR
jgi:hypothetical protein